MTAAFYFKKSFSLVLIAILIFISSCKAKLIPSTNIADTKENRSVVDFLEKYKNAMEKRSVDSIMELVAKDFTDNRGSENPAMQINYLSLKEKLEQFFPRIKDARITMFVQKIAKIDKETFETVFYFNKHFLTDLPSGEKWLSSKDVSKMTIRKKHDKNSAHHYEIVSGI